jgi:hypothetical protein
MDNSQTALQQYIAAATSDNTHKAYRSTIRQFEEWGGWRSDATVCGYIEEGQQFIDNVTLVIMDKMLALWCQRFE